MELMNDSETSNGFKLFIFLNFRIKVGSLYDSLKAVGNEHNARRGSDALSIVSLFHSGKHLR